MTLSSPGKTKQNKISGWSLDEVLSQLVKHNLMLNEEKCTFAASEIDFLGYHVTVNGVYPMQDNIEAVRTLPTLSNTRACIIPRDYKLLRFYLKFVPNYAEIAEPHCKLLHKDVPWEWTRTQQHVFVSLKEKVTSPPVLAYFDNNAKAIIMIDASGTVVGAVLSQWINGGEWPVAFASCTLSETERLYSTGACEALACIYACEHWHIYLYGRKITLCTDHHIKH